MSPGGRRARERLARARLMLLFTPELCGGRDPFGILAQVLPEVDVVQVRVKGAEHPHGVSPAAELHRTAERVLRLVEERGEDVLVTVDDRVDVAAVLLPHGLAGVHVGHLDMPVEDARELLGPGALIGLSTHGVAEVARSAALPVDYLGFGPVHPTPTKGYGRGLGSEAAWVAASGAPCPVFPIGGIDATNAAELAPVGRAAVGSAILSAPDPGGAARALRGLIAPAD